MYWLVLKHLRLLQLQRSSKAVLNGKCRRCGNAEWNPGVSQACCVSLQSAPYLEKSQPFGLHLQMHLLWLLCGRCWWGEQRAQHGGCWDMDCAVFREWVLKGDVLGNMFSSIASGPLLLPVSDQDESLLGSPVWSCIVLRVKTPHGQNPLQLTCPLWLAEAHGGRWSTTLFSLGLHVMGAYLVQLCFPRKGRLSGLWKQWSMHLWKHLSALRDGSDFPVGWCLRGSGGNMAKSHSWSFSSSTLISGTSANSQADPAAHFLRCGLVRSQKVSLVAVPAGGGEKLAQDWKRL